MAIFNVEKPLGWGTVNFIGGPEYSDVGLDNDDGTYGMSAVGEVTETELYMVVKANSSTYRIPHALVSMITTYESREEMEDHVIASEMKHMMDGMDWQE